MSIEAKFEDLENITINYDHVRNIVTDLKNEVMEQLSIDQADYLEWCDKKNIPTAAAVMIYNRYLKKE